MHAQSRLDSLKIELNKSVADTTRIKILHELFEAYQKDSLLFAEETILRAIDLSEKSAQSKLLAASYNLYGSMLRVQSREDSAIIVLNKSLKIGQDHNLPKQHSEALVTLAKR